MPVADLTFIRRAKLKQAAYERRRAQRRADFEALKAAGAFRAPAGSRAA